MNQPGPIYDVAVIGGGINGAGIAADAAGRGLRVVLFEQGDLACSTSSASSKLIHGGLRYLETYEFGLVRKALKESQLLLELAPHLIRPIDIYLPYFKHLRPWVLIRAGLFLYNHLASRPSYQPARAIRFGSDSPLKAGLSHGFCYSDAQVDDARLVIVNVRRARDLGAEIRVRHRCTRLQEKAGLWSVFTEDSIVGNREVCLARTVVNATGPWVSSLVTEAADIVPRQQVRLVKGSHLLVPRVYPGEQAYLLQNADGRIVFVIPYLQRFTMIGTTEEEFSGDPADARISEAETGYLLEVFNRYFRKMLGESDIVYTWSGIRPLIEDRDSPATRVSRDYRLLFENTSLPLLSVYGGKITTFRLLARQAVDRLREFLPGLPDSVSDASCLPGGDFPSREQLSLQLAADFPWLPRETLDRWVCSYGTLSREILGQATSLEDLGDMFGHGLGQREVDYLVEREWAHSVEDILWRRTRLGLLFSASETQDLENYLTNQTAIAHADKL